MFPPDATKVCFGVVGDFLLTFQGQTPALLLLLVHTFHAQWYEHLPEI